MKLKGSWHRALIGLLVFFMAMPAPVFAQGAPPVFRQEELDAILAPIALYPDSLLAQILMASTYPLEVVQADRWVKRNRNLPPDAFNDALERQNWDPSVKALVPFPDILAMMSEKLDWTQRVGDAFLVQEEDVMSTIQQLRAKAYAAGNLRSTQQHIVTREGSIIIVQPANPQVVYVPVYNPVVVYGPWWYPAYPPVVVYPYSPGVVIATGMITFAAGIAVATAWNHWWGYWDWGHRHVYVNVNRTVNIHRTTVVHTRQIQTTSWRHDPVHRKGVAYRDPGTREKYAPTNRQAVDNRRDYRGYDRREPGKPGTGVVRPAPDTRQGTAVSRPKPEAKPAPTMTKPAPQAKPGPATVDRPAPQSGKTPGVSRPAPEAKPPVGIAKPAPEAKPGPAAVQRPAQQTRKGPEVSRPSAPGTIYTVEQGSKARRESARGRESLSSPKGKGQGPPAKAPAVSKPAPAERPAPSQGGQKREGGGPGRK